MSLKKTHLFILITIGIAKFHRCKKCGKELDRVFIVSNTFYGLVIDKLPTWQILIQVSQVSPTRPERAEA